MECHQGAQGERHHTYEWSLALPLVADSLSGMDEEASQINHFPYLLKCMKTDQPRIEWIDTAKGICILLVIIFHVSPELLNAVEGLQEMLSSVRMPLYYTIAGVFISVRSVPLFIEKKVNRLLVPYCFFVLIGAVIMFVLCHVEGTPFAYVSPLFFAFTENSHQTYPFVAVWFLLSLFHTYLFFLLIRLLSRGKEKVACLLALSLSTLGYYLGTQVIRLPFFIDSSMTGFLFFYAGHQLRHRPLFLHSSEGRRPLFFKALTALLITWFFSSGGKMFYMNEYSCSWVNLFVIGMIGVYGILCLSKLLGKVPILTKIGRYSIIYLGTHQYFQVILTHLLPDTPFADSLLFHAIIFLVVVACCRLSSLLLLRYVPFLVAQEDFIALRPLHREKA